MVEIHVGIIGPHGRMSQELLKKLAAHPHLKLSAILARHPRPDRDPRETLHMETLCSQSQVIIDFSTPFTTENLVMTAQELKKPLVIGTTGLTSGQFQLLEKAAHVIPLLYAPNMSIGVTILAQLVKKVAAILPSDFDIEITERHHRHKKDAPSGTAWMLGNAAADGRGVSLKEKAQMGYGPHTPGPRTEGSIGFCVSRGGGVPGDHQVDFISDTEILSLQHRALSRETLAEGALQAAQWIISQPAGFYTMEDVFSLENLPSSPPL